MIAGQPILTFLFETFAAQLVTVVTGVLVANGLMGLVRYWRYGGWSVILTKEGETVLSRSISTAKQRQITDDEADLSVYLKGVVSPYEWLNADLFSSKSRDDGLYVCDKDAKVYRIDLDHNPVVKRPEVCRYPHPSTSAG